MRRERDPTSRTKQEDTLTGFDATPHKITITRSGGPRRASQRPVPRLRKRLGAAGEVMLDMLSCRGPWMAAVEFDDPVFLARLRGGDDAAFRQLVRRFHGALVGTATAIIGSRAQAEEVVQDTWLAVIANIGGFEARSTLATWLFTIAANRARTRAKREGRLVALAPPSGDEERAVELRNFRDDGSWAVMPRLWHDLNPEREIGGRQLWLHVEAVIDQLPPNQKAVLILRDIDGRSAEDACALLEVSAENQRVLLHRARGRVRRQIDALLDAECAAHAQPAQQSSGSWIQSIGVSRGLSIESRTFTPDASPPTPQRHAGYRMFGPARKESSHGLQCCERCVCPRCVG